MKREAKGWAQWGEALARKFSARVAGAFARAPRSTPLSSAANQSIGDIFSAKAANSLRKRCKTSGWIAGCALRSVSIRKKVIGHGMRAIAPGFRVGKDAWRPAGTFPLFEKPARQHGGGVLLHPLINQRSNFLAEIGSMGQAGQFKALQGVPRSRKQELPRWLSRAGGHKPPLLNPANIISTVRDVKNTYR
jgi:hypothetical protein